MTLMKLVPVNSDPHFLWGRTEEEITAGLPEFRAIARDQPHHASSGVELDTAGNVERARNLLQRYRAEGKVAVEGAGGNRLWLVPSLQLAILCTGAPGGRDADWDDNRLPNLVIHAARDALPTAAQPGADISALVPGH